jgi:hypothetical protein
VPDVALDEIEQLTTRGATRASRAAQVLRSVANSDYAMKESPPSSEVTVELEGSGRFVVECTLEKRYVKLFEPPFKPGDTVTFMGAVRLPFGDKKNVRMKDGMRLPKT